MAPRSFSVSQPRLQTILLKYELFPDFNREQGVLLAGDGDTRRIEIGMPLGLADGDEPDVAKAAGFVGGGTLTLDDPALSPGVVPGIYRVVCYAEDADGGSFFVFDPAGANIGDVDEGDPFEGPINFQIDDVGTDFAIGDTFTVTVHPGTKFVAWDPAGVDGSQVFSGLALQPATAADGVDGSVLVLARGPAIVASDGLVLPEGTSADERAALYAAMEAKGVVVRLS